MFTVQGSGKNGEGQGRSAVPPLMTLMTSHNIGVCATPSLLT